MTAPDITLRDEIACIAQELRRRRDMYSALVYHGTMPQEAAAREIAVLAAVLRRLEALCQPSLFEEAPPCV